MALTIYDISRKAGVSIATVSRVLNGSSSVKPSTREKVMSVIEKYDYTPDACARGMGLRSLRTVGILCADSSDIFLARAVYHIERELRANGYDSLLCCTGYDLSGRKKYSRLILSKRVDSLILVGSTFVSEDDAENEYIREAASRVPVMLLNASCNCPNVYSMLCDDHSAMFEATSSLLRSGIRDILYLYDSNSYSGTRKLCGYRDAMKNAGAEDFDRLICYYGGRTDHIPSIASFIGELGDRGISFHGVIASDDSLAAGALRYAQEKGLSVPRDLAIVGYNNSMLATCTVPEITSVDNRLEDLTHRLVETLLRVLSGEELPSETVLTGRLVSRGTTP